MTKIVLVDDDLLQLKLNKAILESEGYEVWAASEAADALAHAHRVKPDLIVSDVLMGEVDGFGLCRRVKADEDLASIPVLLLSAHYGGERNAQLAKRVGARALVERTAGFERELEAVRACLSSKEPERARSSMYEEHLASNAVQLKKLASQAAVAESRYQMMIRGANAGIGLVSATGVILEVNRHWAQLLGYAPEELVGRSIAEFVARGSKEEMIAKYGGSIELGQDRVIEALQHRDGRVVWMEISMQLVEIDGVPQMFAVSTDVTARIEAERRASESEARQRKTEEVLAHAQKLESLGRLTGGIAHDFNNLLSVIMTHASFLAEDLAASDPRRGDALEISAACERAAALTKQLLAFSRRQHLTLAAIEPSAVIENLARMLQRLIGEDLELEISTGNVGTVRGDVSQLEQVIVNLVVNARDAMPDGGTVSVEVARTAVEAGVDEVAAGEWVVVSVRDTGCGMGEETKARLFEPFYTTKEWGKGTGLGLSTSYGIVKQFGGHILVESELGKGTVVKVLLPSVALEVEPAAASRSSGEQGGCETVLLVEDDRAVRAALGRVLVERGYDVMEAGSLDEAVDRVRAHPRAVDLVICDVVMPGGHGTGVMDRLAVVAPQARVLLMSGYTDHARLAAARVAGQSFLQKPFAPDVLSRRVRDVLGGVR